MNNAIKETRVKKGLSQARLAEVVGVTQQTISNWENGSGEPCASEILGLSRALGISVTKLVIGSALEVAA